MHESSAKKKALEDIMRVLREQLIEKRVKKGKKPVAVIQEVQEVPLEKVPEILKQKMSMAKEFHDDDELGMKLRKLKKRGK